jgi:hypothetical protein
MIPKLAGRGEGPRVVRIFLIRKGREEGQYGLLQG